MAVERPVAFALSDGRADAEELARTLTKAWMAALYLKGRPEVLAYLQSEARTALERLNARAAAMGIDPKVLQFRNFRTGAPAARAQDELEPA